MAPGFSMNPAEHSETQFLEHFKGRITEACFCLGRPIDKATGIELGVETAQINLKWRPLGDDQDSGDQMGYYSMGKKTFQFADPIKMVIGQAGRERIINGFWRVAEGPPLHISSRASRLFQAMVASGLAIPPGHSDLHLFIGTEWEVNRVEGETRPGLSKEGDLYLPVKLLTGGAVAAPVAAVDIEEQLLAAVAGKKHPSESLQTIYPMAAGNMPLQMKIASEVWIKEKVAEGKLALVNGILLRLGSSG